MVRNSPVALALCACALLAQATDRSLSFDAASVKPAAPGGPFSVGMRGGPGSSEPGQFTATNATLLMMIMQAYDVPSFRISGPSWLRTERFNIVARVRTGATREQFQAMLQNLLADRFGLVAHRETRQEPIYALAIDKRGLKMRESRKISQAEGDPPPAPGMAALDKDGFPKLPAGQKGLLRNFNGGRFLIQANQETTADLAGVLSDQLDRPVLDQTGLKAAYDFTLEFSPMPTARSPEDGHESELGLSIFGAVKRLGLKLESRKALVEQLVVDHADKTPTEN